MATATDGFTLKNASATSAAFKLKGGAVSRTKR
jgi:hypothetical protein